MDVVADGGGEHLHMYPHPSKFENSPQKKEQHFGPFVRRDRYEGVDGGD